MTWYDPRKDPAFLAWNTDQQAADRARGTVIPIGDVPELVEGLRQLDIARELLEHPDSAGALAGARKAIRQALGLIPQPRPDSECAVERWNRRHRPKGKPAELCTRRTCGRCLPLRAAQRAAEDDPGHPTAPPPPQAPPGT
ncbi:hypothetical protein ABTY61_22990 [Kitasatospora sp. NPDC096128]|uniref:hypothetical protein n=1 Tax=Kitasatospora sp. NPDC096128 TaxID=3155547 RepID=UPI00332C053E